MSKTMLTLNRAHQSSSMAFLSNTKQDPWHSYKPLHIAPAMAFLTWNQEITRFRHVSLTCATVLMVSTRGQSRTCMPRSPFKYYVSNFSIHFLWQRVPHSTSLSLRDSQWNEPNLWMQQALSQNVYSSVWFGWKSLRKLLSSEENCMWNEHNDKDYSPWQLHK